MRQIEIATIRVVMADDTAVGVLLHDAMSVEGTEVHQAAIPAKEPLPLLAWRFRAVVRQNELERPRFVWGPPALPSHFPGTPSKNKP